MRTKEDIIYGQIIDITKDSVKVICSLLEHDDEPGTYFIEVRNFPVDGLFEGYDHVVNGFIKIEITYKPGSRTISVYPVEEDISYRFVKKNYFKNMEDDPSTKL